MFFNSNKRLRLWSGSDGHAATEGSESDIKDSSPPVSSDLTTEHIVSSVNSREEYLRIFQPEDYPRLYEEE